MEKFWGLESLQYLSHGPSSKGQISAPPTVLQTEVIPIKFAFWSYNPPPELPLSIGTFVSIRGTLSSK